MQVVSVNTGQPREIETGRGVVVTSIYKMPIVGRAAVKKYNIVGDRQADLSVHGGPSKAVYGYAAEHYPYWKETLGEAELGAGSFGENLTVEGLDEDRVQIGDQYRVGTCVLRVTQPRMPCWKLALRMERADMVKLFWRSGRSGVYFGIVQEGELGAGDEFELVERAAGGATIGDVVRIYKRETEEEAVYERVLAAPLSGSWKEEIRERWLQRRLVAE